MSRVGFWIFLQLGYNCYNQFIRVHNPRGQDPPAVCNVRRGGENRPPPPSRINAELIYLRWKATLLLIRDPWNHIPTSALRQVMVQHPRLWLPSLTTPHVLGRAWKNYFYKVIKHSREPTETMRRHLELTGPVECEAYLQAILRKRNDFQRWPPLCPAG